MKKISLENEYIDTITIYKISPQGEKSIFAQAKKNNGIMEDLKICQPQQPISKAKHKGQRGMSKYRLKLLRRQEENQQGD